MSQRMSEPPPIPSARPVSAGGDNWTAPVLQLAAVAVLAAAVAVANGNFHPLAIALLTVALALALFSVAGPPVSALERRGKWLAVACFVGGFVLFALVLFTKLPTLINPVVEWPSLIRLATLFLSAGAAALVLPLVRDAPPARAAAIPLLLCAFLFLGSRVLSSSPEVVMDVFVFQTDASSALLHGQNPYSITFPDHSYGTSPFYAPGVQVNGRLAFGFPYLPLSLLLVVPSYGITGDVRVSHLVAVAASAGLMAVSRRGPLACAAAAFFVVTPAGFYVLQQGWTEPLGVALLAATVWSACRRPDLLPLALGLFLAIKQYTLLSAPLALLLVPRPWTVRKVWDLAWKAALVAVVVTLPFVLWGPKAFWWSTVGVQVRQPFRTDALSYLAALANWKGVVLPAGVAFVAMAVVEVLALLRAPRTPAGFAASMGLAFLVFFAFNKQAFANYYYFVIGAFACAIAAAAAPLDGPPPAGARVQSPPA
jgi:hypothetical protein